MKKLSAPPPGTRGLCVGGGYAPDAVLAYTLATSAQRPPAPSLQCVASFASFFIEQCERLSDGPRTTKRHLLCSGFQMVRLGPFGDFVERVPTLLPHPRLHWHNLIGKHGFSFPGKRFAHSCAQRWSAQILQSSALCPLSSIAGNLDSRVRWVGGSLPCCTWLT